MPVTLSGHALGIAPGRALPGQPLQRLLRRQAGDRDLAPGTGRPARRARSGSARRSRACAPAPPDSGRTAAPSPPAASGSGRRGARGGSRASSMVQPWRMQVTTSCRMRRPGTWNSTSLVTTVGTPRRGGQGGELVQPELVARPAAQGQRQIAPGRRRRRAAGAAAAAQVASGSSGTSTAIRPSP